MRQKIKVEVIILCIILAGTNFIFAHGVMDSLDKGFKSNEHKFRFYDDNDAKEDGLIKKISE